MSIAREVERYVDSRASLKRHLAEGLINKSRLARKIAEELGTGKFHAVHMALRRMKFKPQERNRALRVIRGSRIEIRSGISVALGRELPKGLELVKKAHMENEEFHFLQEPGIWVAIAPRKYIKELEKHAFKKHDNLIELVIKSPPAIEKTPGVLAEILAKFADVGINIVEFLSCWTDTILLIDERDLSKAVRAFEELQSSKLG